MLKVAIFTNAYKPIASGVVNSIELVRNALIKKGHEVYIFAPKFYDYEDEDEYIYRYSSMDLTRKVKFPIAIPVSLKMNNILNEIKPDIIHAHHPFVLGKAAHFYARKLDVPMVYTFHTQYEMYSHYVPLPANLVRYSCRRTIKNFAQKADCTITPAESIAGLLKTYGIKNPVHVIPNAIDLDPYRHVPAGDIRKLRDKLGLGDSKVVLFVGRIAPEKNLLFLLDSFRKAAEARQDVRLLIVGDGPQLAELKDYAAALGISDRVVFTGGVEYKHIPVYYRAADTFALASTTEVKPLVILEALAAGLPVVAVNAPGAMDTLTDNVDGILTSEDTGAFADGLARVLGDNELYERLKQGANTTADSYSIDQVSDRIVCLYEDTINRKLHQISS